MQFVLDSEKRRYIRADGDDVKVVGVVAGDTAYYGGPTVDASSNDGSLTAGQEVELSVSKWLLSQGSTLVRSDSAPPASQTPFATQQELDDHIADTTSVHGVADTSGLYRADIANVKVDHGAVGDGTTDDSAAFAAAYATGLPVYVPAGTYRIVTAISGSTPLFMFGDGPGKSILLQDADARVISIAGSGLGSTLALTANAAAGADTLTLSTANAATLAAGDLLELKSTVTVPGLKSAVEGEIVRVKSVDTGTGVVTLHGQVEVAYTTANTSTVAKISTVDGSRVEGLTIRNTTPSSRTTDTMVLFNYTKNVRVRNVQFEKGDQAGVKLNTSVDWVVEGCKFLDFTNDTVSEYNGYGVLAGPGSKDGLVSGCFMRGGRHLFTTGGQSGRSVPKHVTVANCLGTDMDSAVFDTHEEGQFVAFVGCVANNTTSYGFYVRAPGTRIKACSATATRGGVFIDATNGTRTHVEGFTGRLLRRFGANVAVGVTVQADDCTIENVVVDTCDDYGVDIQSTADRCTLRNARVVSAGGVANTVGVNVGGGANHVLGNIQVESTTTGVSVASGATNLSLRSLTTRSVTTARSINTSATWLEPLSLSGSGTPESAEVAPIGSTFQRTDGGAGTSFYVKESGTGNTGWAAK